MSAIITESSKVCGSEPGLSESSTDDIFLLSKGKIEGKNCRVIE